MRTRRGSACSRRGCRRSAACSGSKNPHPGPLPQAGEGGAKRRVRAPQPLLRRTSARSGAVTRQDVDLSIAAMRACACASSRSSRAIRSRSSTIAAAAPEPSSGSCCRLLHAPPTCRRCRSVVRCPQEHEELEPRIAAVVEVAAGEAGQPVFGQRAHEPREAARRERPAMHVLVVVRHVAHTAARRTAPARPSSADAASPRSKSPR